MRAHKLISKAIVALCALVAILTTASAPASAEVTHKLQSRITEIPSEGPSGEPVALSGLLDNAQSMTVDGGDLYVAEQFPINNGSRVDVFDTATHAFVRQFDQPAPPVEETYAGIAVGHATGSPQVYVGAIERIGGEPYGVVVPFDAEGHQLGHPWTGADTPNGSFSGHHSQVAEDVEGAVEDVAVDNDSTSLLGDWAAGDVLVDTRSHGADQFPAMSVIDVFKPEAGGAEKYLAQLRGTCGSPGTCLGEVVPFNNPTKIAVDPQNGDLLVVDADQKREHEIVDMFRPGPLTGEYEFLGSVTESPQGPFTSIDAITVDGGEGSLAEGAFYVDESGVVYQFNPAGQYIGQFSASSANTTGLAADPAIHDVYVGVAEPEEGLIQIFGPSLLLPDVTTEPVSDLAPESAKLNGTVDPDNAKAGETTCQFAWGSSESLGHAEPCSAPVAEGASPVPVSADLQGLEPGTTYYYRLQASNANGTNLASQTQHFTTLGPGVAEESAFAIASTSATLAASIDPHGASTTYYFQYGPTTAYGSTIPAAPGESVGAGESGVEVTRHLQGLSPSASYHYRVVVASEVQVGPGIFEEQSFDGRDQTFTTQSAGGSLILPDGRAWELVSPPDKHGANIFPLASLFKQQSRFLVQASAAGNSITYLASAPTEAAVSGYTADARVLSERGADGWSSQDLMLPHRTATEAAGGEYQFFSEDLSIGLAEPALPFISLAPEVMPPDTEGTLYLRHNDTCTAQPSTCYLPLVTGAVGYADVPPGTVIDPEPESGHGNEKFVGATTDLRHVLFLTRAELTSEPNGGADSLYEWSAGKQPSEELQLISHEIPVGRPDPFPVNGKSAISSDGSRVLFETMSGHLDQRETTRDQTVQLDEVQPGASGAGQPSAVLQAASSDGTVVYFTDLQKLTKDSGSSGLRSERDLYECRIVEAAGKDKCSLTDLTPATGTGKANVEGLVLGASEDSAYIYFVAAGVLSNQPDSEGETAVAGGPNLYEIHNGAIELVAVLSPEDRFDWNGVGSGVQEPSQQTARVSPGGRYLAFMSDRSLTGYDNVDVSSGKPDEEVFLFDSTTDRLICASCNPSGARPEGEELNGGVHLAANIPGWTEFGFFAALRQPRYLSDSGRLFFDSSDALVPRDVNKNEDVYEYEPSGVGDCSASTPGYEVGSSGCIGLISSGTARGESTFMEASESGDDVFFLTTERLVGSDTDSAADVYDAHVCSTAAPCPSVSPSPPPPCATADACRAAPSPQPGLFGAPASATFAGAGNVVSKQAQAVTPKSLTRAQKLMRALKVCRRQAKHKRATCERKARKRYSSKPAPRARVTKGERG